MRYKNILIIGHSNIGDLLHNTAILKPLAASFSGARVTLLTSPVGKILLEGNSYLSDILIFDKSEKHKNLKSRLFLAIQLRKKKFDLIINLKSGSFFPYFLGAKKIWGIRSQDKTLFAKRNTHAIDIYLNVLKKNQINVQDIDMKITYSKQDQKNIETLLQQKGYDFKKPLIVFAPFSAWHAKEWEPSRLGMLAKKLSIEHQKQVVFVGGAHDKIKMETIFSFKDYFIDLVGKTSLKELAALYGKAELAIGADSGPFHLATNMQVAAIGIFGATAHLRGKPYFTPQHTVFCEKDLGCNPCIPGPNFMVCNVYNRTTPCMQAIPFEHVYERVKEALTSLKNQVIL